MSRTHPKITYTSAHMTQTLRDLELPPSAIILIQPVGARMARAPTRTADESLFNRALRLIRWVILTLSMLKALYSFAVDLAADLLGTEHLCLRDTSSSCRQKARSTGARHSARAGTTTAADGWLHTLTVNISFKLFAGA